MTQVGLYAIGTSTPLESNKSLTRLSPSYANHVQQLSCFTPNSLRRLASFKLHTYFSNRIIVIAKLFCILYALDHL